jgi:hypothetical protein
MLVNKMYQINPAVRDGNSSQINRWELSIESIDKYISCAQSLTKFACKVFTKKVFRKFARL